MSAPLLIGLGGKKKAGKDTVCRILGELYPDTLRLAFADALKAELAAACDVPISVVEEKKDVFRLGLQWWGTEFRRGLSGPDYWVDQLKIRLDAARAMFAEKPGALIVVTDVRFPNEADFVRAEGGLLVQVRRESLQAGHDLHLSETALDDYEFDYTLTSGEGVEKLRAATLAFVATLRRQA